MVWAAVVFAACISGCCFCQQIEIGQFSLFMGVLFHGCQESVDLLFFECPYAMLKYGGVGNSVSCLSLFLCMLFLSRTIFDTMLGDLCVIYGNIETAYYASAVYALFC